MCGGSVASRNAAINAVLRSNSASASRNTANTVSAPVTALVGQRVYWVDRPQAAALPAIVLQTISDPRPQHLKGFDALRETRVQLDVFAANQPGGLNGYDLTRRITEAAIAALVPENSGNGIIFNRALVDGARDLGERTETQFIHRHSIDLLIWWQAA